MRSAVIVSTLLGLTAATPLAARQAIEFDQFDAAVVGLTTPPADIKADPGHYDSGAAVAAASDDVVTAGASKIKRDSNDCTSLPAGSAPVSNPDNAQTFLKDPTYSNIAQNAPVPQGYSLAFSSKNGATESPSYITYKTMTSYDTIQCQQFCDAHDACYFFNVFMERDPSIVPADACPNPASTVYYKCSLFGAQMTDSTATNNGQWRAQFQTAIAGSNGYNKLAPPPAADGFSGPVAFGGAIQAPDNSYMGYKYYAGPYDPSQCAASCQATTAYDQAHPRSDGTYDTCAFFNAYVLSENNVPQGTYCSMYTKAWGKQYSTNVGQYRGSDYYSVSQSYGYTLNA